MSARHKNGRIRLAGIAAVALGLGAALWAGLTLWPPGARTGRQSAARSSPSAAGSNLVVITVDTLRADHLPPYGYREVETPTIAQLAREGVLFKSAYTPVPLTLPAHTSILTGLLPFRHGVRDNGGFYLDSRRATLATMLKASGYQTGGFVSAFVLDSRWGLARGFDRYFDDFPVSVSDLAAMARVQRPAGETWAQARQWLDTHAGGRFFMWLHLFDPHAPYTPPEPFRSSLAARPYDGEIAYVDSILGELLADLKARTLLDNTLVVFLSDHGEGLGDHGEDEHGLLSYDSTLRVPWIVRLPHARHAGTIVEQPVSLVDVVPTVLGLLGLPQPAEIDGTDRALLMTGGHVESGDVLYAETYFPRLHFNWSELVGVRNNRFKYIRAPRPELYDYRADPGEASNLAERQRDVVARFEQILTRMLADQGGQTPRAAAVDPETARRLGALGYIGGEASISAPKPGTALADPKDKTGVYKTLMRARQMLQEGPEREGLSALENVVVQNPDLEPARRTLREYWLGRGRAGEGAAWFRAELARRPDDIRLATDLATLERAAGEPDRALEGLQRVLAGHRDDADALTLAGQILRDRGRFEQALDYLTRAAALASDAVTAKIQVAQTLVDMGRLADGETLLNEVLKAAPHAAGAHYLLAQAAERRRDGFGAEREYRQEIQSSPWDYRARFNLAVLLGQRSEHREQAELLESIPKLAPEFPDVFFYLAKALLDLGDPNRFSQAIAAAQRGLALAPTSPTAPLGHYVLADIARLQGRTADAEREIRLGQDLEKRIAASVRNRAR